MLDWILSTLLQAQMQAAERHAQIAFARQTESAEREAAELAQREGQDDETRAADGLGSEALAIPSSAIQALAAHDLALDGLAPAYGGRALPVHLAQTIELPEGTRAGLARWSRPSRSARSLVDLADPAGDLWGLDVLGLAASSSASPGISIQPFREIVDGDDYHFYEITMNTPGFLEKFLLYAPNKPVAPHVPLLVIFHGFGSSHWDVWVHTEFIQECQRRGWYLVCPLGATNKSFASPAATLNREMVFDWMLATFVRIDVERVYGVGFSMGAGEATNYAARHLDPARTMFAALVNHTGGVDLNHTYASDPPARFIFDYWYGDGTPNSADPWQMARSSLLRFDPLSLAVQADWDLARNLRTTPLWSLRADLDPIAYLGVQNDVLDGHMQTLGVQSGAGYAYDVLPSSEHSWDLLDEAAACDFLEPWSLVLPQAASVLADRDAVYYWFEVEQDASGAFTPFTFALDPVANHLVVEGTANLAGLWVDTAAAGLDAAAPLVVELEAADGQPDAIRLRGFAEAPLAVLRDGLAESAWSFDAQSGALVLAEYDPARHVWEILP